MRYLLFIICLSFSIMSIARSTENTSLSAQEEEKIYEALQKLTPAQWREKFKAEHPRVPKNYTAINSTTPADEEKAASLLKKSANAFRSDARFPAEFEELQGVFISWPYTSGVIDIVSNSPYAKIYLQLADAIQKNAVVYINVEKAADTTKVFNFMSNNGAPLFNYKFLVNNGDDVWARDFGPVNYYYGAQDSIGWLDFKYYPGRNNDNLLPQKWGKALNIPYRTTIIGYEGGNILMDGRGRLTTTSMVTELNLLDYGISAQRVKDSLDYLFNLNSKDLLTYLPNDGGTGHIDLYIDMVDENTYVYAAFPEVMKSIPAFPDYAIAKSNIDTLMSRTNFDNKPFRFRTMTLPPKDDGSWYTSGSDYNNYTRTYINHLFVNKAIIQPIFHNSTDGYKQADDEMTALLEKNYPGYTIYPIDMRDFDGSGGSIHCITKEFHAENPLTIWHYAYDGEVTFDWEFPINTTIHNHSGIASAFVSYRLKGEANWIKAPLTKTTGENFIGKVLSRNPLGGEIEYYIEASSVNGKTMQKPITAPKGFYTFKYAKNLSSVHQASNTGIGSFFPNPMNEFTAVNIDFNVAKKLELMLYSHDGKLIKSLSYDSVTGKNTLQVNTADLPQGVYYAKISANGEFISSSRLVKQ
jgi:agmatine/peptidylarginine deiminase